MTQKHALVQGMNPRQEEAVLHTEDRKSVV